MCDHKPDYVCRICKEELCRVCKDFHSHTNVLEEEHNVFQNQELRR